ncbi:MAG: hypothetical protein ACD_49C00038G0051 [uncultured bacterium (gcode 4)]|uniref:Alpha/beta hydrolase n=1 Tax=uncultured bacterium (gcode 4) TaxID=1234023 RepID=K2AXN2_9BACT|nr:MAG: hypothetical protein ACD_49C00038G0051 [uncultured bacterium (gcode 4)]
MIKIIYIIPGFWENTKNKRYFEIQKILNNQGFKIISVKISWKNRVMSDYVNDFLNQFNKHTSEDEIYLLWFSFWAMISFIASTKINIKAQFLCSLSPYFKEDIPLIKEWRKKNIWIKRIKDLSSISFDELVKNIKCKTYIFYGAKEWIEIERRAKDAGKKIKDNELLRIEWAKHDLWQDSYINAVKEVILKI